MAAVALGCGGMDLRGEGEAQGPREGERGRVGEGIKEARAWRRRGLRATTGGIGRAQGERRRAQGAARQLWAMATLR